MTAKIGLKDVRFHAPHGFFEEEHRMGNEFSIDVEVEASIGGAAEHDDLGGTVNYATIYYLLNAEMKKPTQLLEALAYRMATRIAEQFDSVTSVTLRLRKLNPPLGGKVGSAEVELTVGAGSGGTTAGGSFGMANTFDDEFGDNDFDDGPFGGGSGGGSGGGGGMGGIVNRPPPPPPPMTAAPAAIIDDDAFDDDEYDDDEYDDDEYDDDEGDFLSDEELAAMTEDGGFDDEDFDDDFDFDSMDFDDLDLPDFDPDEFE